MDLASPKILSSPSKKLAERRLVNLHESSSVNWARPFRVEQELSKRESLMSVQSADDLVHLFGASSQRSRRLNRTMPQTSPFPSPVSSSEEDAPLTPSSFNAHHTPDLSAAMWDCAATGQSLGMPGIGGWESHLADYFDHCGAVTLSPTSSPSFMRPLSSSTSFSSLASPSTLDELRSFRQAALDFETDAWQPTGTAVKEKKIKRKPVPAVDASDLAPRPLSSPNLLVESPRFISLRDLPTELPIFPRQRQVSLGRPSRTVYQTHYATQSVIEISPRSASLPFSIPTRVTSHRPASPSSSSTLSDQPITPTSEKEAFFDKMDGGLRRLGTDGMQEQRYEAQEVKVASHNHQHKRGLSRFLWRRIDEM